jgi:hypothetical protein
MQLIQGRDSCPIDLSHTVNNQCGVCVVWLSPVGAYHTAAVVEGGSNVTSVSVLSQVHMHGEGVDACI